MKIGREFYFDAAHSLPEYKGKCEQVHGHTYKLEVEIEGKVKEKGLVLDFEELKRAVEKKVIDRLDHKNLNEILENPTCEKIAEWSFRELKPELPLHSIKLWEGQGKWVLVEREG